MTQAVHRQMRKSAEDFAYIVWPRIGPRVGGGKVIFSELVAADGSLLSSQDIEAGVDAWQLLGNSMGMRGIASRVQWCDKSYRTFTIRYRTRHGNQTEWQKRVMAISHDRDGILYPALTIQAYMTGKVLLEAGAIRTKELFRFAFPMVRQAEKTQIFKPPLFQTNGADGNMFCVVRWVDLVRSAVDVVIVGADMLFDEGDLGVTL